MSGLRQTLGKKKGFTLVELLIVLAVIAILFTVYISRVDFASNKAKETGIKTDFRSFELAAETVIRENGGFRVTTVAGGAENAVKDAAVAADGATAITRLNGNLDKSLQLETGAATGTSGTQVFGTTTKETGKDPWGNKYTVSIDVTGNKVTFTSAGADGILEDDAGTAEVNEAVDNYTLVVDASTSPYTAKTTGFSSNLNINGDAAA